ncbi:MAG TPA: multicopper oxidase domain-containing protein [Gemmatimonadota bacterium]|nr:multicopper oxidase domain-containing protein [Gemmatimonadota bacterium]
MAKPSDLQGPEPRPEPGSGAISRRTILRGGAALGAAALGGAALGIGTQDSGVLKPRVEIPHIHGAGGSGPVRDIQPGGFDPTAFASHFDGGRVSTLPDGRTLRDYHFVAVDREIEVAPGVWFPAWTYNGSVPGPTIRCTEGDRLRVRFQNAGTHPHTIHFHGFHPANMDGVFEIVDPGSTFVYEFDAEPFGLHLYHCHTTPLKRHIHKGLYGAFIVDPPGGRPPAREYVMVMNGFDTDFDSENEFYAVNTVAFHYMRHPLPARVGEKVRLYVVNTLEFDLVNSLHVHANFFEVYRTGTRLEPDDFTDTVMFCQGERHILELEFRHPGMIMFHAHQSEFAELGWMGFFDVAAG